MVFSNVIADVTISCRSFFFFLRALVEQICASIVHFLLKARKFGMMIVFKALKEVGYGAIAKTSVKCEK